MTKTELARPMPLHELIDLWARSQLQAVEEERPCACGGVVTADPRDPGPGVSNHQAEWRHEQYARRTFGEQAQPERPTAGPSPVDVSGLAARASAAPAGKPPRSAT